MRFLVQKQKAVLRVPNSKIYIGIAGGERKWKGQGDCNHPASLLQTYFVPRYRGPSGPRTKILRIQTINLWYHNTLGRSIWSLSPVCHNVIFDRSVMSNKTRLMLIHCNILIKSNSKLLVCRLHFACWIMSPNIYIPKLND